MPFERNKGNHNSIHVFVLLVTSFPKDIHAVLGMSLIAGCWLHCNFTGWKRLSPWLKLLWKTKTWGQLKGAVKSKIQLDQNKGCLAFLSYILAVLFYISQSKSESFASTSKRYNVTISEIYLVLCLKLWHVYDCIHAKIISLAVFHRLQLALII